MANENQKQALAYVDLHKERLIGLIQDLVRIPSENKAPQGSEGECQEFIAGFLRHAGWEPDVYELGSVAGLEQHTLFLPGRQYEGRPNVGARRKGTGGGRSLILSGHIDTVPRGTQPWTRDAFGGQIEGNRLYGRGSNDMKAGVAINLFVAEAVNALNLQLTGDLIVETVVDEEFGGVNGTIAGRLRGYTADAAILSEPSFLRICAAQRGGRTVHITFTGSGGILSEGQYPAGAVDQLTHFLVEVQKFAQQRRQNVRPHPLYAQHPDPVPVSITKIFTSPWGTGEPITTPEECKVEMYWQFMPGETQADGEREFLVWFDGMVEAAPRLFPQKPKVELQLRWLPGSAIAATEPLVTELNECVEQATGKRAPVTGIEGPCDMFAFHEAGIPAVLWGPRGGNTHAADEYVEIDSAVDAARALLLFVCRWCG